MHNIIAATYNSKISFFGKHLNTISFCKADIFDDGSNIAYYPLNGDPLDHGGKHDGVWVDKEDYAQIGQRKVGRFVSGSIKIPNMPATPQGLTISGWIYSFGHTGNWANLWHMTPDGTNCCGNSRQPGAWLRNTDNRDILIGADYGNGQTEYSLTEDLPAKYFQWNHVVTTIKNNTMKIYVNKILRLTRTISSDYKTNGGTLYIVDPWHNRRHLMADVRVIGRGVNDYEVDKLYKDSRIINNQKEMEEIIDRVAIASTNVASDDFASGNDGWNVTTRSYHSSFGHFLGRFGGTGGSQYAHKTYNAGEPFEMVRVKIDIAAVDSWDTSINRWGPDYMYVFVNDEVGFTTDFGYGPTSDHDLYRDNYSPIVILRNKGTQVVNVPSAYYGWRDNILRYDFVTAADKNGNIKIGFGSGINQGMDDESWGICKVEIYKQ
jgi:hypothetical protein